MSPASPSAPPVPRYRSLDLWRGVACLMIVVFHQTTLLTHWGQDRAFLAGASGGAKAFLAVAAVMNLGVPMFFVISGYCVTASADHLRARGADLKSFFWRRFHRIFPPYWAALGLALALYAVSSWLGHPLYDGRLDPGNVPGALTGWNWLGTLTLTEGWRAHVAGGGTRWLLTHAWSLGYEEQFYAVTGLVLLLCARRLFRGLAVVTGAVIGVALVLAGRVGGLFFDGAWVLFALGVLAYYWATIPRPRLVHRIALGVTLALAIVIFGVLAGVEFAVAGGFAGVIIALRRFDDRLARIRPLMWVGKISYSLYLSHVLVVVTLDALVVPRLRASLPADLVIGVTTALAIALSIGLASLFFRHVEQRFGAPRAARQASGPRSPTSSEIRPLAIAR